MCPNICYTVYQKVLGKKSKSTVLLCYLWENGGWCILSMMVPFESGSFISFATHSNNTNPSISGNLNSIHCGSIDLICTGLTKDLFVMISVTDIFDIAKLGVWVSLQWRHNERDGVSNHQPRDYYQRLFRRRPKKTSKLLVTGHFEGNSLVTGEFPAQRSSNAEIVSIWWRHQVKTAVKHVCDIQYVTNASLILKTAKLTGRWDLL